MVRKPTRSALVAGIAAVGVCLSVQPAAAREAPGSATVIHPELWPEAHSPAAMTGPRTEARVRTILAAMTLEEKVGQLIQADIGSITPEDLSRYPLGSILAGGSSSPGGDERSAPGDWLALAQAYRDAAARRQGARIPLLFGVDAVHGHSNIVGATLFPHNIGLGAAHDPALVRDIAAATAREVAATGVDWTFAPTLAVPRDDRWGRTYEGFAENPQVHRAYARALVEGLQGPIRDGGGLEAGHVMGSAKHFLADGGTTDGRDRGDAAISEREMIDIHLSGYPEAIDAGVLSVMVSFSGWNGVKHTGNQTLLTDVLRGRLGFEGLVIGDWDAHAFVPGCRSDSCPVAINAGLDMFMAPTAWRALYDNTLAQARDGAIPAARLDEAVSRILRVKIAAGVFDHPRQGEGDLTQIGSADHRDLARRAVRASLVLLKNNDAVLPIRAGARVLVAGPAADDIGTAAGGWTIGWQGTGNTNADFPGATSIWAGIRDAVAAGGGQAELKPGGDFTARPDVAVVVFGEAPYAEYYGDLDSLDYAPTEGLEVLKRLKAQGVPTVAVFLSGRPLWINPEINASDAVVAAWLPGSEGTGVADVLIGDAAARPRHDFTGRLSFSWPADGVGKPLNVGDPDYTPLFAYGYGLDYRTPSRIESLSETSGLSPETALGLRIFDRGRFVAPWAVTLRDPVGGRRVEQPGPSASPGGAVAMTPIDGAAQESARRFVVSGEGGVVFGGPPTPVQPGQGLAMRYRVFSPSSTSKLTIGSVSLSLDHLFGTAGEWNDLIVPLACFGIPANAPIAQVRIDTAAGTDWAVERLGIVPITGSSECGRL